MNILICDDDRQYVDLLNKYVTSFSETIIYQIITFINILVEKMLLRI